MQNGQHPSLYIGLMSGTSADGIDAALVAFETEKPPTLLANNYVQYDQHTRDDILALMQPNENEIERLGTLDHRLGHAFAEAAETLLRKANISPSTITAIGSHGQTIRHRPSHQNAFTLQIGDPNIIAARTGITTIADFRRKDMALGGQGAPLVPAFHQAVFQKDAPCAIVNIGGIANITLLNTPKTLNTAIMGFDTGPGNALMDAWCDSHGHGKHDVKGGWAASGTVHQALLAACLEDPYFHLSPPKSTGREYFYLAWLQHKMARIPTTIQAADVQATLTELTATTILQAIQQYLDSTSLIVCGGGVHNDWLMSRLKTLAGKQYVITTSKEHGIDPDWVEAMAFAWLAKQTMERAPGNCPSVTGAKKAAILGGIYLA